MNYKNNEMPNRANNDESRNDTSYYYGADEVFKSIVQRANIWSAYKSNNPAGKIIEVE